MSTREKSIQEIREWMRSATAGRAAGGAVEAGDVERPAPPPAREPISILGVAGYFPGAMDVQSFWRALERHESMITEIPAGRFDWQAAFHSANQPRPGAVRGRWGGFIPDIASFDPGLFRILPAEADYLDPRQRLLLMATWRALEDAGIAPASIGGSATGVFVAGERGEYGQWMREAGVTAARSLVDEDSLLANQISYRFGLLGPSEYVNTMCSGFAVALHRALRALRSGEIDRAIVGAANLILRPERLVALAAAEQLSRERTVRSFDRGADGYVSAEGVGVVVLERLRDARAARRHIYANILHAAVNHNGAGGMSIGAPNTASHTRLIGDCYREAGIDPRALGYIEAQGMGVAVADIAEWTALNRGLAEAHRSAGFEVVPGRCRVSTLKPLIGHMHAASSLGALLKIVDSLQRCRISKVLGFTRANEYCDMQGTPCRIAVEDEPWERAEHPRLAALHSYGMGGNNAHIVVEETAPGDVRPAQRLPPTTMNLVRCWFEPAEARPAPAAAGPSPGPRGRPAWAQEAVRQAVAPLLKRAPAEVELSLGLRELGFDSLTFTTLAAALSAAGGVTISPAVCFGCERLGDLADHLARVGEGEPATIDPPASRAPQVTREVAVVGMAGVFPGARDIGELWRNLVDGRDCIDEVPASRWGGEQSDRVSGGFIADHDTFDPLFFGIAPREATFIDPQVRKAIETIWHAIEDSGHSPESLAGRRVGIFLGISTGEYQPLLADADPADVWSVSTSGLASLGLARISDLLNLQGPLQVIEAACSSSLLAVHQGVTAIRSGDCDMAIVGGVHLMLTPTGHLGLKKSGATCADGRCKSFSSAADGYGRGEGSGVVVLADPSQHDGPIYATIKGSAVNHDGRSTSLTAPNPAAQQRVIREAQERAGVTPGSITYIEAHGTGTPLGDAIEIEALKAVFRGDEQTAEPVSCAIGTVKSHIGHLEIAAGISGLIKTVLQLKHRQLIKVLHLHALNPHLQLAGTGLQILHENRPWQRLLDRQGCPVPLRAGVSAFGLSGVNVHVVLEEVEPPEARQQAEQGGLLVLSAKTEESLRRYAADVLAHLERDVNAPLADVLYTFQVGRSTLLRERLAIVCQSRDELLAALRGYVRREPAHANVFTGGRDVPTTTPAGSSPTAELAARWASGAEVRWSEVLPRGERRRVSGLPGYPFASERYWPREARARDQGGGAQEHEVLTFTETWPREAPARDHGGAQEHEVLTFTETWHTTPPAADVPRGGEPPRVLVCFLSDREKQEAFARAVRALHAATEVVFVAAGAEFAEAGPNHHTIVASAAGDYLRVMRRIGERHPSISAVAYLWSLDDARWTSDCSPIVSTLQALAAGAAPVGRLVLGGQCGDGLERCHVESWHAFRRSTELLLPELQMAVAIRTGAATGSGEDWARIVWRELDGADTVLYAAGTRHALRVAPSSDAVDAAALAERMEGTILITGGAGALGLALAGHLAGRAAAAGRPLQLILGGRSALGPEQQAAIARIEAAGVPVAHLRADVCDAAAMRAGIEALRPRFGAIRGVIHAAGLADPRSLLDKDFAAFSRVTAPKIAGTLALDAALHGEPLRFVCYFSSISATLGDFGACDYAVGNRFELAYARHRNQLAAAGQRAGTAIAIAWPYWAAGGMRIGDQEQTEFYLRSRGLRALTLAEGLAVFDRMIGQEGQRLVIAGSGARVRELVDLSRGPSRRARPRPAPAAGARPRRQEVAGLDMAQRVEADLLNLTSRLLQIPVKRLDTAANLADFGFDSINLTDFARELGEHFGVPVTPVLFFAHSTLGRLTRYFVENHGASFKALHDAGESEAEAREEAPPRPTRAPDPVPPSERSDASGAGNSAIAIVGMSGRFPMARTIDEMWERLIDGADCITEVPAAALERPAWPDLAGRHGGGAPEHRRWAGLVPGIDEFDPVFFEISPREAEMMDPGQRLLLQEAWRALEDAGYGPEQLRHDRMGMFVGVEDSMYRTPEAAGELTGTHGGVLAARLAYFLDFGGPVMAINTACSSSLVALHQAISSLRNGECDTALVAGVGLIPNTRLFTALGRSKLLSANGRCAAFGLEADGIVPGEAVAVVVLKRLDRARRAGDRVHAVIRASGVNHDGRTNGITAPSATAQEALLARVYRDHDVDPASIDYVVAHGTGTRLGDPVEVAALTAAFRASTAKQAFCALGSVKSNLGHTLAASGLVSLITVVEALRRNQRPATLHVERDNPHIDWRHSPFYLHRRAGPWPVGSTRRRGAVSAFGMSGTNAHVVVEEPEAVDEPPAARAPYVLLPLSAKSAEALAAKVEDLQRFLARSGLTDRCLPSLAYTLQSGRHHFAHRLALVVGGVDEVASRLAAHAAGERPRHLFHGRVAPSFGAQPALRRYADELAGRRYGTGDDQACLEDLCALGELYCSGYTVAWDRLYAAPLPRKMSLPTYPFARGRYWTPQLDGDARPTSEPFEVLTFADEWQQVDLPAPPRTGADAPRGSTLVCLLSDRAKQRLFLRAMQAISPHTEVVFVAEAGRADSGDIDGELVIAADAGAMAGALKQIQARSPAIAYVVYLWSLDGPTCVRDHAPLFALAQAIATGLPALAGLVLAGELEHPLDRCYAESWHGLKASLGVVLPDTRISVVMHERQAADDAARLDAWARRIWGELSSETAATVLYRAEERFALRVSPRALRGDEAVRRRRVGGTILVTGGAGGLGQLVARHLAASAARAGQALALVLTGRSEPTSAARATMERIVELGCSALYLRADVCDPEAMRAVVAEAKARFGAIRGVMHVAGVPEGAKITEKSSAEFATILAPKVRGTLVLDEVLADEPLEFVCYFSSLSAVLGDFGSCDYAMGNRFQNAHAHHRNELVAQGRRSGKTFVINWPLWRGGGMGLGETRTEFYLQTSGQRSLSAEEGLAVLDQVLGQDQTQCVVVKGKPGQMRRIFGVPDEASSAGLAPPSTTPWPAPVPTASRGADPRPPLASELTKIVTELLKLPPAALERDENLARYGFDSISLADLAAALTDHYGLRVVPATLYEHPTLGLLEAYLSRRLAAETARPSEAAGAAERPSPATRELVHLNERTAGRPVFWFHPGLGGVQPYAAIARAVDRPFHGLQARGRNAPDQPIHGLEAIAAHYCRLLRSVQPEGPYDLGGYSLGGLIGYEVARQLQTAGCVVDTLLMIDAPAVDYLKQRRLSTKSEILQTLNHALASQMMLEPREARARLVHRQWLERSGSDQDFLAQLTRIAEDRELGKAARLTEMVQRMISVQRAYQTDQYELRPLSDPGGLRGLYLRNASGLFFGEMAPYYLVEEDATPWDHHDHWGAWRPQSPSFELTDVDASSHITMLSEPQAIGVITELCQRLYRVPVSARRKDRA